MPTALDAGAKTSSGFQLHLQRQYGPRERVPCALDLRERREQLGPDDLGRVGLEQGPVGGPGGGGGLRRRGRDEPEELGGLVRDLPDDPGGEEHGGRRGDPCDAAGPGCGVRRARAASPSVSSSCSRPCSALQASRLPRRVLPRAVRLRPDGRREGRARARGRGRDPRRVRRVPRGARAHHRAGAGALRAARVGRRGSGTRVERLDLRDRVLHETIGAVSARSWAGPSTIAPSGTG